MTDLPPGWTETPLGNLLLRIEAGKSFRCESRPARPDEWGIIKVSAMTWGEFQETENKAVREDIKIDPSHEIKPGDILFSRANTEAYVGASVIVKNCRPRLLLSDKSLRLIPSPEVEPKWLAYALNSPKVRKEISRRATGTKDSMRNISQSSLREVRIPLPPLAEQHQIIATLETKLKEIKHVSSIINKTSIRAKLLRNSIVDSVASGYIIHKDRPLKEGFELAPGWRWAKPDELTSGNRSDITIGPFGSSLKVSDYTASGVPLVFVRDIRLGKFGLKDPKFISQDKANELSSHNVRYGDVLITKMGDPPGDAAVYTSDQEGIITADCIRLRPGQEWNPTYLAVAINSSLVRRQIKESTRGVAQQKISLARFREEILIPVPPVEIQDFIVTETERRLSALARANDSIYAAERKVSLLRQSLLNKAFSGQLASQGLTEAYEFELLEQVRMDGMEDIQGEVAPF